MEQRSSEPGRVIAVHLRAVRFSSTLPAPGQRVWGENLLYNFTGMNGDGAFPYGTIISDRSGNIYGTTMAGGRKGSGTVFKVQH